MRNMRNTISKIWLTFALLLLGGLVMTMNGQVRYCMNYTEFVKGQ